MNFLNYKIIGASKKFKNQLRPLVRPGSVNFHQNFWNISHETVPLTSAIHQHYAWPDPISQDGTGSFNMFAYNHFFIQKILHFAKTRIYPIGNCSKCKICNIFKSSCWYHFTKWRDWSTFCAVISWGPCTYRDEVCILHPDAVCGVQQLGGQLPVLLRLHEHRHVLRGSEGELSVNNVDR